MLSGCAFEWNRSELQIFCPVSHSWMIISFSPIQANTQKSPGSISLMLIFTKFEINAYCATITKKKRKIREKLGNWCADYESWAERVLQEAKSGYKKKASVVSARQRLHRRPMSSSFFQQRRADDGYLVFRPSLKLRNRTRLRLFSSSFLAWNSPWILKPRCTTKAVLSTENLYPATWSSQAWREIKQQHEKTDVEVGSDESERGEVREDNDTGDGFGIEGRRRENKGERADMRKERWNVFFRYEVSGRGCVERWNRQRCGDISTGERRSLEKEGHEV